MPYSMNDELRVFGIVAKGHLLRGVFTSGRVPLDNPFASFGLLGDDSEAAVYFLALPDCSPEEIRLLATIMASAGQGPKAEALEYIAAGNPVPIRAANFERIIVEPRDGAADQ